MSALKSFTFHRAMKRIGEVVGRVGDTALFVGTVLIVGLGSSWYMVDAGSALTTQRVGPWVAWTTAARPDADPYTRAHFSRSGMLPMSSEVAPTFIATTDDEGVKLHSSCDYIVEGPSLSSPWWSISVFDQNGRLIASPADRYAYTSDTVALGGDGRFTIALARDARPGNWLPTGRAGRLALVVVKLDPPGRARQRTSGREADQMPSIRKVSCR